MNREPGAVNAVIHTCKVLPPRPHKCGSGFTLLEVLVALAILALSLTAALRAGTVATHNAGELRARQLAAWVAQNRIEEHRARRAWPPIGQQSGESMQGDQLFHWSETINSTPKAQFRRIEVRVRPAGSGTDEGHHLARLIGFIAKPRG